MINIQRRNNLVKGIISVGHASVGSPNIANSIVMIAPAKASGRIV